jgi:exosome complex component RRP42
MSEKIVANLQKKRIVEYLKEGKRFDGRAVDAFREAEVKLVISENAEGSCSVKMGKTEVYAGVKLQLMEPYSDSPDEGSMMVGMELGPMADDDFEMGAPKINAIEMGRVIDRGIRESGFVDFKGLCIKEGEKAFQVCLDLYAVNNDGNLFDVAALAGLIALANAKLPVYNEEEGKIEHEFTKNPLPLNKEAMSVSMTYYKVGDQIIVDPTREEEEIADYRITITIADNKGEPRITAMQKGEHVAIPQDEMDKILELVEKKFKEDFPKFSKLIWGK